MNHAISSNLTPGHIDTTIVTDIYIYISYLYILLPVSKGFCVLYADACI